jgi:antitoxin CptB
MNRVEKEKLKWKCRRGLLELDLLLERYLKQYPEDEELLALLDLPDTELWDIVAGRSDDYDPGLNAIVARLRATKCGGAPERAF